MPNRDLVAWSGRRDGGCRAEKKLTGGIEVSRFCASVSPKRDPGQRYTTPDSAHVHRSETRRHSCAVAIRCCDALWLLKAPNTTASPRLQHCACAPLADVASPPQRPPVHSTCAWQPLARHSVRGLDPGSNELRRCSPFPRRRDADRTRAVRS